MNEGHRESVGRDHFTSPKRRFDRAKEPQLQVTLSVDLFNHLQTEARSRNIPLRWLVAGLVCDTMKPEVELPSDHLTGLR